MLMPKTSHHIRTHRNVRHRHSCRTATGIALQHIDQWRVLREEAVFAMKLARHAWLNQLRARHLLHNRLHRIGSG